MTIKKIYWNQPLIPMDMHCMKGGNFGLWGQFWCFSYQITWVLKYILANLNFAISTLDWTVYHSIRIRINIKNDGVEINYRVQNCVIPRRCQILHMILQRKRESVGKTWESGFRPRALLLTWINIISSMDISLIKPGSHCWGHCHPPDSKVHEAYVGPTWDRQDPGGPHVGPMKLAVRELIPCRVITPLKLHLIWGLSTRTWNLWMP